jgi:riboflavin transporter FmnP
MGMALAGRPGAIIILFCMVVLLLGLHQSGNHSPMIEQLINQFAGALFLALSTSVTKPTSSTKGPDGA